MAKCTALPNQRWGIQLESHEMLTAEHRALAWTAYKGNNANLFGEDSRAKAAGIRGELAFKALLVHFKVEHEYGGKDGAPDVFDFRIGNEYFSIKTQRSSIALKQTDRLYLHAPQAKHETDFYVFLVNIRDGPWIEVLGQVGKESFLRTADALTAGQILKNRFTPDWEVKADCYTRRVSCLRPLPFATPQ